ncbi:hypothetical protein [uncultured Imperialibacter sp.]|uniref:hypothetical protein n=1 Tax=uncultured Imperialibacter sp. TaxID=1672639 RepID=UPI0030DCA1A9|tara:strand:+ start:6341 stop:7066 length:726 start_codon:yes stop_codon:yes gene_type:complete
MKSVPGYSPHVRKLAMVSFLLLLSTGVMNAQIVSYKDRNVVDYQDYINYSKAITGANKGEDYEGSPYMDDEFKDGIVFIEKDRKTNPVPMRYNMYADQMEFKRGDFTYLMEPVLSIDMISVGEHLFILGEFIEANKYNLGFFEVIDTGRLNVMMKQVVRLRPGQAPKAMESAPTLPTYLKLGFEYYYQLDKGEVFKISKVKALVESLPDHQDEMRQFVKKERISRKKEDLRKLAAYYNSLK